MAFINNTLFEDVIPGETEVDWLHKGQCRQRQRTKDNTVLAKEKWIGITKENTDKDKGQYLPGQKEVDWHHKGQCRQRQRTKDKKQRTKDNTDKEKRTKEKGQRTKDKGQYRQRKKDK